MPNQRVLIIDDEPTICRLLKETFVYTGYETVTAASGSEGLRQFYNYQPDLVILDLMMPEMNGWEVCRQIRQLSDVPVIMVTALGQDDEVARGLQCGADDYVVKPFSATVLLARVEAVLRRAGLASKIKKSAPYADGFLTIDVEARRVLVHGQPVKLSLTEYRLLTYLFQNAGRVLTFQQILKNVWGETYRDDVTYVHSYIWCLRQKLEPHPHQPIYLLSEHGVGYCFEKQTG